jgi:phosphate starvation-inducible protein PhoH
MINNKNKDWSTVYLGVSMNEESSTSLLIFDPIDDEGLPTSNRKKKRRDRKEFKKSFKQNTNDKVHTNESIKLKSIYPKTKNQEKSFKSYGYNNNIIFSGTAGTGKSFLALYFALQELLIHKNYSKIEIIRPAQPTVDVGFLPGKLDEKIAVYEAPYVKIVNDLVLNRKDFYKSLKNTNQLIFSSTSYLRGITFEDSIIILEEAQNATLHEISSVITRLGDNCKLFVTGDTAQNDIYNSRKYHSGFSDFLKIAEKMKSIDVITFNVNDIVRSDIVKEFIIAKENLGL